MSILIKDMEMPTSCGKCPFGKYESCQINLIVYGHDSADCPLIEIPPHGRLIDVDVAYDEFLNLMKIQGAIDPCQLGRILVCAPTIIEAENSFFNSLKCGLEQAINGDVRKITIIESEDGNGF